MADITMPQLGETVTEGTITRWLKAVGDSVAEDDVLFEVSTDKVDSEVPSPVTGYLVEILVPEGETVDVGTRLAVIGADAPAAGDRARTPAAEPEAAPEPDTGAGTPSAGAVEPPGPAAPAPEPSAPEPLAPEPPAPERAAESPPPSRPVPQATGLPTGQGPSGGFQGRPGTAAGGPAGSGGTRPADERPPTAPGGGGGISKVLSPVVRRLIAEHGLDPAQIEGSGAGGRITRDDVLALIDRQGAPGGNGRPTIAEPTIAGPIPADPPPAASLPAVSPGAPPAPQPAVTAGEGDTIVPFTNIRRRTAEHMVRSQRTSAHTVVSMEVDFSAVDRARRQEKDRFRAQEGFGLTYLPFVSRAVIEAIANWPHINSSVGDDNLIVHNYINLGIAVDLNFEGLLVPVIHEAGDKRLRALAREIANLADRARTKRLTMDDISGGTFTITNAGPFGTLFTVPVISQPQVAILATDGVRKRPVVIELPDGSDAIAIHPVGNLVLSFDHRAVDGAYASAFMRSVKDSLESRDWSAEL